MNRLLNAECRMLVVALVTGVLAVAGQAATYYWDDGTVTVNAASGGGSGTWQVGAAGWEDGSSAQNWANGNAAVFGGTAGTVTISGGVTANGLTLQTAGYTIQSSTLTLGAATITGTADATIASALDGTAGLAKGGAGTLTLSGANTYSGSTVVSNGKLKIAGNRTYVRPVAATAESWHTPDDRGPTHAIDGSGMTPTTATPFAACGTGSGGVTWLSNGKVQSWITFDLGSVQTIAGFHLWNYNEIAASCWTRSVKNCGIYAGTTLLANNSSYASGGAAWGTLVQNMTFACAPGLDAYAGEDYYFDTPVTTRYIQIWVIDNYLRDNYTGIAEIGFYALAGQSSLPAGTAVNVTAAGAALDLGDSIQTVGSLAGVAGSSVTINGGLTAGGDNSSTEFAGALSGVSSFAKTGSGLLTLSGVNTYGGGTTINGGTLKLTVSSLPATPTAVTAQSNYGTRPPGRTIDGSGMSTPVTATSTCGNAADANMWLSNNTKPTWITFDLGSTKTLSGFHLWNYNEHSGNPALYTQEGVNSASIYTETSLTGGAGVGTFVQNMTFSQANGSASYTGSEYSFTSPVTTRYIEIYANSNFGAANYTGISEILFNTAGSLPATTVKIAGGATLDLNGTSQTIVSLGDYGVSGGSVVNSASSTPAALTLNLTSGSATFSGTISDSGAANAISLVMPGAGTQVLSGNNAISGLTTVNGGVLQIGSGGATGTLGSGSIVNNANLVVNRTGSVNLVNAIRGGGNVTFAGSAAVTLSGGNTYAGTTVIGGGTLKLTGSPAIVSPAAATAESWFSAATVAARAVDGSGMTPNSPVTVNSTCDNSPYTGSGTMWMSANKSATWIAFDLGSVRTLTGFHLWNDNELASNLYLQRGVKTAGMYVLSSLPANGSAYSTFGGALAESFTFSQANGLTSYTGSDYSFSTPVSGQYILMYVTGNWAGTASYTGISEILFNTAGSLPPATPAQIAGGATLDLNGGSHTIASLADYGGSGGFVINSVGSTAATLTINPPSASTTFSGAISDGVGTVGLVKSGAGTQVLSGNNTYSGATTITAGTLKGGAANVLGGASSASALVMGGGTLDMGGYSQAVGSAAGAGTITSSGGAAIALTVGNDNTSPAAFAGVIQDGSGTVGLTKIGTGTLTLSGANAYTGATVINGGTLKVTGVLVAPTAATAQSYYTTDDRSFNHAIDGSGMSTPVTATSTCGNVPGGYMWLSNNTKPTWITFDLGSTKTLCGFHLWNYNENSGNPAAFTQEGVNSASIYTETSLTGGSGVGTFVQNMTFSQANGLTTYTGSDYVFNAPVTTQYIEVYANSNFSVTTSYTGISEIRFNIGGTLPAVTPVQIAGGSTLDLFGASETIASLADYGGSGGSVINSASTRQLTLTLSPSSGSTAFSGTISDSGVAGAISLVKSGAGTQTLSGPNNYHGTTTIDAGTLRLGATGTLRPQNDVTLSGGELDGGTAVNDLGYLTVANASSTIRVGVGGALRFSNSSSISWSAGGHVNITGTLTGTSLRFGTGSSGLTAAQVQMLSNNGNPVVIDVGGYVVRASQGTIIMLR